MMNCYFDGSTSGKIVFHFVNNDRTAFRDAEVGSITGVVVKDNEGKIMTIRFQVTRNASLVSKTKWVYGRIMDVREGKYYQIELKLHKDEPQADTVEAFLQAPPLSP